MRHACPCCQFPDSLGALARNVKVKVLHLTKSFVLSGKTFHMEHTDKETDPKMLSYFGQNSRE